MLVTNRQTRTKQRGFTLTELAIVLGIVGLILGAIWVAAAAVYSNQRVNKANTSILQTVQAVRSLYSSQATIGTGDQTSSLILAGIFPVDMVSGTNLVNPWNGAMTVSGTSSDGLGLVIQLTLVPQDACIGLISRLAGTSRDKGLFLASANTTTVPANVNTPLNTAVGPTATGCSTGNNTVMLGFTLKG